MFSLLAAFLLLAPSARAMSPEDQRIVERGMDSLYRADYEGAEKIFTGPAGDPVLSLGRATAAWGRMEHNFALPGSADEKAFKQAVEVAIAEAKEAAHGEDRAEGVLYLGAAYGLRGRWEAAQHHWFSAYVDGRRAYAYARKAVALDPTLYDAYMGIGAFDYYLARLGKLVRALTFMKGGNRERGLQELDLAARKGRFAAVAAQLLVIGIDWTFENKPEEAWASLEKLHKRYPDSPTIDSLRLIGLFRLRDAARLKTAAQAYFDKAQAGAPFFKPMDAALGRFFLGAAAQFSGEYEAALSDYEAALKALPEGHRWRSLILLSMGEADDLLGRRDKAVDFYDKALDESPLWGVPRYAKHLKKHPFQKGDDPLPSQHAPLK